MKNRTPLKMQIDNICNVLQDGPAISTKRYVWIVARNRKKKKVLVGGLGCMGIGQMWCDEVGHEHYPNFNEAPGA